MSAGSPEWSDDRLRTRSAVHAALGEPARLAIIDELVVSDRSPKELAVRLEMPSNLLAHHLEVLEQVGLIERTSSAGDGRRKYVRLRHNPIAGLEPTDRSPRGEMLFLCSHNSARSQLAAALWTARTGLHASSAGTHPAARVHRGAVAAARRAGVSLTDATPTHIDGIPADAQVVTVCDRVHEELTAGSDWWHWSIADPVENGSAPAFDAVVAELETRIAGVMGHITASATGGSPT
ncbi:MAG TPA: helix-turn-helix domain-containing protein [Ilumatobacter sp.]|nr:helix-turn-helix domain-containing protein [Ilumatobacter sp.]